MASIVLSFVGNQDPYSEGTELEGSIATLIRHLLKEDSTIRRIILLHTEGVAKGAEDTKDWLQSELNISPEIVDLLPVSEEFSRDPVNLEKAAEEARKGLKFAEDFLGEGDRFEFNASSGTPVMKTSWSLLQAAGYARESSVWQVRNPRQMKPGQEPVFKTNVDTLKNEFDAQVIQQQVDDYNYAGALVSLDKSKLSSDSIKALLEYGKFRLAFDFKRAFKAIEKIAGEIDSEFISEIESLRSGESLALLKEVYYKALTRLKNQQYADFLVDVTRFQEQFFKFLVGVKLGSQVPEEAKEIDDFWEQLKSKRQLYNFLEDYRFGNNRKLFLTHFPNLPTMRAILEYYNESPSLLNLLDFLDNYCKKRNGIIHNLKGISNLDDSQDITRAMREALQEKTEVSRENRFTSLNRIICAELGQYLRG